MYPSLLDAFKYYLDAEERWEQYEGGKEEPSISIDEYCEKAKQEFIDKINRVPFESEAADKGTAFNVVIDCLIERRLPTEEEGVQVKRCRYKHNKSDVEADGLEVKYKDYTFLFDREMCLDLATLFKGAIPQYRCEGILPTKYGNVLLYGYLDELLPNKICDIKTTSRYTAFKFRDHFQHLVYPYCINYEGGDIKDFEYNCIVWGSSPEKYNYFVESYSYDAQRDIPILTNHIESLIEFLNNNKKIIKNQKIFNNE